MIDAFERLGFEVIKATGYGKERKEVIVNIKKRIIGGEKFDFVYSESSTQPTLLTEKNHLPKYPGIDFNFFKFCKSHNIKIGLFYRDIYWLFPSYNNRLPFFKRNIAKIFYRYDLFKYNSLVDNIYLPSMQMANHIPIVNQSKFKALPPGHDEYATSTTPSSDDTINLLYIGGLGAHYQMRKLFSVLKDFPKFRLTLCTRENEWKNVKDETVISKNILVIHKSGEELIQLYQNSDIALLFVEPLEYWSFAAPVKLFEYIGQEKPVIASIGTLAGQFVEENDIGWNIEYDEAELKDLFVSLDSARDEIFAKKQNIVKIKQQHTWEARALQVQKDLGQ